MLDEKLTMKATIIPDIESPRPIGVKFTAIYSPKSACKRFISSIRQEISPVKIGACG